MVLSDDGGLTWRVDSGTHLSPPPFDSRARVVGDVVHVLAWNSYQRWSFTTGARLQVNGASSLTFPGKTQLIVDPANNAKVWVALIDGGGLVLYPSTDGGATFVAPTVAEAFPRGMVASSIQLGADGRLHLIGRAGCSSAALTYSTTHALGPTPGFTDVSALYLSESGLSEFVDASRLSETAGAPPAPVAWITEPELAGRTLVRRSNRIASPESVFGSDGYGLTVDGVNAATGGFTTSATDLSVASVGPTLGVTRTYNSADQRVGLFGKGWTSNVETRVFENCVTKDVTLLRGDGRREFFASNGTGYVASPGYTSTLAKTADGWTLTDLDGGVMSFRTDGRLVSVADADNQKQIYTWSGSQLTTVTDQTSGRALTLGYTGGVVTSVSTTPVTSNGVTAPITATYAYSGNQLVKACDPRSNNTSTGWCSSYVYTNGALTQINDPNGKTDQLIGYDGGRVAWQQNGAADKTTFTYGTDSSVVTDGRGSATTSRFDSLYRLVSVTDAAGGVTRHEYDTAGYRWKTTDPNGNVTTRTFDARGNTLSETNGAGETTWFTYDANNNVLTTRDGRSASATDATFVVTSTWDGPRHNKLTEKTPVTAQQPSGTTKRWTYTTGAEAAVGGGLMPANLVRTQVDERGATATFSYDSAGNLRETVDRLGLRTTYTYDQLGRRTGQTVFATGFASGVTTTFVYDALGNVVQQDDPATSNAITGVARRKRTVVTFDAAANKTKVVESDIGGSATPDVARTTLYDYDAADRVSKVTDPEGGTTTTSYDAAGNVMQVTDPRGVVRVTVFDALNRPTSTTAKAVAFDEGATVGRDVIESRTSYDLGGRIDTTTDPLGRVTKLAYDGANRVASRTLLGFVNLDGTTRNIVLEATTFDKAGNPVTVVTSGIRTENRVFDAAGRMVSVAVDPTGANKVTSFVYDANGNITTQRVARAGRTEETRFAYNAADLVVSRTVENGTVDLVTTSSYDNRGIKVSEVDPRGNLAGATAASFTTTTTLDALGRVVRVQSPPVAAVDNGVTTASVRPDSTFGFDTYGQQVGVRNERSFVTTQTFDRLGRVTQITHPSYTPPGGTAIVPTELFAYDRNGNLVSKTDRRGKTTTYVFDGLNRVRTQTDPRVGAAAAGVVSFVYDDAGNTRLRIDQRGAKTRWTYDAGNRVRTQVQEVRQPTLRSLTTTYNYDDLGNVLSIKNPVGDVTTYEYSKLSEHTAVIEPGGFRTTATYDTASRAITVTDPLGRKATSDYDLAGRATAQRRYSPAGTLLTTMSMTWDAAGNQITVTSPRGNVTGATPAAFTTTTTFDAINRPVTVTEPITATTTRVTRYGYDLAGNVSIVTDGRNNATIYGYAPWNVQTTVIEPSTTAHPNAADRTWTTSLDAGGLPVKTVVPGAITVTRVFDELGRLTSESGAGAGASTASRTFGWDATGLRTSFGVPGGSATLAYDDRGLLLSATGPTGFAGSSFAYDDAGRQVSRTDASGTVTTSWSSRGLPVTVVDPLSGQTGTSTWDAAAQLTKIAYAGGGSRSFAYDDLGRVSSDQLKTSAGAVTAGYVVGYDVDSNVTSRSVTLPGNSGAGANSYGYDNAGRLTSWTKPGGVTVGYGYDNAGNLTSNAGVAQTFDQRNRMLTSGSNTYVWAARGVLATQTAGAAAPVTVTFDGLDRLTGQGAQVYGYDSLDRIVTQGSTAFGYAGVEIDPARVGTTLLSHTSGGQLLATKTGTAAATLTGLDHHGDVIALYTGAGTVSGTRTYTPLGAVIATGGTYTPPVGFQADYTDPATADVWMGARWYRPGTGGFTSRDTVFGQLSTPVSLNRYTYAWADPLGMWDPDGRWPKNPLRGITDEIEKAGGWIAEKLDVGASCTICVEDPDGSMVISVEEVLANPDAMSDRTRLSQIPNVVTGIAKGFGRNMLASPVAAFGGVDINTMQKVSTTERAIAVADTAVTFVSIAAPVARGIGWARDVAASRIGVDVIAEQRLSMGLLDDIARQDVRLETHIAPRTNYGLIPCESCIRSERFAVNTSPTVGELRAAGQSDAHHIIQDAAVWDIPGYKNNAAPGRQLAGGGKGSPHYNANQVQRTATIGGTYGAERQVACSALLAAGVAAADVAADLARADAYFMGELGLTLDSPTRVPGNRRGC
ncbi:MAG: DUF6531 domain-containing protein [Ilumatobacteraceae bacterium]